MPDKCIFCGKNKKEKMYIVHIDNQGVLFHVGCLLDSNPDLEEDVKVFLKYRLDKKEEV
jgi:hypothetical protein